MVSRFLERIKMGVIKIYIPLEFVLEVEESEIKKSLILESTNGDTTSHDVDFRNSRPSNNGMSEDRIDQWVRDTVGKWGFDY